MTIEFGDSGSVDVPGVGPVIGNEFAQVSVNFDTEGNSPRLRLEDLRSGRVRTSTLWNWRRLSGCPRRASQASTN